MADKHYNVYEVDCGVTYWVAAPSFRLAADTFFKCVHDIEGMSDDDLEHFAIEKASAERVKNVKINIDGGWHDGRDSVPARELAEYAAKEGEPQVIGCSEWP